MPCVGFRPSGGRRWRCSGLRDGAAIGGDDADDWCRARRCPAGRFNAEDRALRELDLGAGGGTPERTLLGVAGASSGRLHVRPEVLRLTAPMVQQRVGAGQRSPRAEKNGQEQEGDEPAGHGRIIPGTARRGESDPGGAGASTSVLPQQFAKDGLSGRQHPPEIRPAQTTPRAASGFPHQRRQVPRARSRPRQ